MKNIRVGLGFDLHVFTKRKKELLLCGVKIPCGFGTKAVSDGDVALHAISDGILGAAGLGDIGDHFPPRDKKSLGIKSQNILDFVLAKIKKRFKIGNIDIIIVAQKPPLVKYKPKMVKKLKLSLKSSKINIKIKSKEKQNILGGINSISCFALVTLKRC